MEPHVLVLPVPGAVGPTEALVPEGPVLVGGDVRARNGLEDGTVWVERFTMMRAPVSNREYFRFLASDAASDLMRAEVAGHDGVWHADWPVTGVSWHGAQAYAAWFSRQTGLPWRLPNELEWEKAARGVDGRHVPWGDHVDPTFCNMLGAESLGPCSAAAFPFDKSVYGVCGLGGNVSDWCADPWNLAGPIVEQGVAVVGSPQAEHGLRIIRGGSFADTDLVRSAARTGLPEVSSRTDLGFRLVRSL